jgi:hypothetical protein
MPISNPRQEVSISTFASFPVTGDPNVIYVATDTSLSYFWNGASYSLAFSLSGDATINNSAVLTISNNVVTDAKLAQIPTQTFKGRTTAGTGNVETLTATQATAMLNVFTSSLKGLVPASGGGTTNFLRADGTWAVAGSGTVTSVALALPSIFSVSGSPVTTSGTLTGSLATQAANTVFAGPTSGGAVAPTFRVLAVADVNTPVLGSLLTGLTPTSGSILATDTILQAFGKIQQNLGFRRAYRMTSAQVSSSTTYANLTQFVTASLPVGDYKYTVLALVQTVSTGTGFGLRFTNGTATVVTHSTAWWLPVDADNTVGHFQAQQQESLTFDVFTSGIGVANQNFQAVGEGFFSVTVAGTVSIQVRSEVNGSAVTIGIGSCFVIEGL